MKRRTFLLSAGLSAGVGSLVLGTGAFSAAETTRGYEVAVTNDVESFLSLNSVGSNDRSITDDGVVRFSIPGDIEEPIGEGVGIDSLYFFGEPSGGAPPLGLFHINNHGSQPVEVFSRPLEPGSDGRPTAGIFDATASPPTPLDGSPDGRVEIDVGGTLIAGLWVNTEGVEPREEPYEVAVAIQAEA